MTNKEAVKIKLVENEYDDAMAAFGCCLYKEEDKYIFKAAGDLPVFVQAKDSVKDLLMQTSEQLIENYNTQASAYQEFENGHPESVGDWISYLKKCYTDHAIFKESARQNHIPKNYPEPEDYYSDLLYQDPQEYEIVTSEITSEVEQHFSEKHPFLRENQYFESTIRAIVQLRSKDSVSVEDYIHICEQAAELQQFINDGHSVEVKATEEIYEGGIDENGHERKDNFSQRDIHFTLKPADDMVPFPTGYVLRESDEASYEISPLQSLSMLAEVLHDHQTTVNIDEIPVFESCKTLQVPEELKPAADIISSLNQNLQTEKNQNKDTAIER